MALLQISEPDFSPEHCHVVVGIDLGTTHSLIATVLSGKPTVLKDAAGQSLLPSVVHYAADGQTQCGALAQAFQLSDPNNTLVSIKRMMGRSLNDLSGEQKQRYQLIEEGAALKIITAAGAKSPIEVSALILNTLKKQAEQQLSCVILDAVITVPAYFDDAQRQATKDAAQLAGLRVMRLLNEPTAAALAYGLDRAAEGIYAIYDLGGGTFDLSLLRMQNGLFEVLATAGDTQLGGDDFDQCLCDWICTQYSLQHLSHQDHYALLQHTRQIKEKLSEQTLLSQTITLPSGISLSGTIDQNTFTDITRHLIERTLKICQAALHDAKLHLQDIQAIVLVGGATRMPHLRTAVSDFFAQTVYTDIDPDQTVAIGAALQAQQLAGQSVDGKEWLLLDVIPLSLGVEMMGGLVEKIIPRNATIPCQYVEEFTTFKDGQTALALHVVQGERELAKDCRSLARFELRGIPPMVAGAAKIRISYQVDADGLLSVSAQEMNSGVHAQIQVNPSHGLNETQMRTMLEESFQSAQQDMLARALAEQQIEAQRLLQATQNALAEDSELLASEEKNRIEQAMTQVQQQLKTTQLGEHQNLSTVCEILNTASEAFAEKRMQKSIHNALVGQSLRS